MFYFNVYLTLHIIVITSGKTISFHDECVHRTAVYRGGGRELESHVVVFPIQDAAIVTGF